MQFKFSGLLMKGEPLCKVILHRKIFSELCFYHIYWKESAGVERFKLYQFIY